MTLQQSRTHHKHFNFISNGELLEVPTVRSLLRQLDPEYTSSRCQTLLDRFLAEPDVYALPVVDDSGSPVTLVDRKHYIEFFSKPYSRELFGQRAITSLFDVDSFRTSHPVIVEENCSVDDVAQIIINAGMQHMATGFIVTREGRYLGVANGHDLLNVITQRKQAELYYLAHYDSLTGLPNRMLFIDRLEQARLEAERSKQSIALLFIDIDRFKQINDSLGHRFGDAVLCQVAERLKATARRVDTVARLGGDEFVVLMESLDTPEYIDMLAERIVQSMRAPMALFGHSLVVTVSVGCAVYPNDDTEMSPLLAKADAAMYEAKSSGRDGFRKYSPETAIYNPTGKLLENELRGAIERDELILYFQPQVKLRSNSVCGVEALTRWRHPEKGMVSPGEFIPIAEESGLIIPLSEWMIHQSFRHFVAWRHSDVPPLRLSLNISALQFQQAGFTEFIKECIQRYGVEPQFIELELTESLLMQNIDKVVSTLDEIKRLGVKLAIDDFGTGYSCLSYLSRFPIDRLKIDQSFVRNIETSPANESIIRTIVALASSLSLEVIAEGIETAIERDMLEDLRCSEGQGYLFAKPMPAAEFARWLASRTEINQTNDLFDIMRAHPQVTHNLLSCPS